MAKGPSVPTAVVGALAALAAGALTGIVAERRLVAEPMRADRQVMAELGSLSGETGMVRAVDGTELFVDVDTPEGFRPGRDLTIIFSHGYTLNSRTWHFQRTALRPLARLVFWDQRAHGRSGRGEPGSHNIDQLGLDLNSVIQQVAPDGPLLLVGHSMGGMTVMSLAAAQPDLFTDRVIGVALMGTSSGDIHDVALGLPAPIARAAHRFAPSVAPTLIRRRDLIEASRGRSSDLTSLIGRRYSFGSPVSPEIAQFTMDMINGTPIDVVAEFLPTFDKHDKRAALAVMTGLEVLVMVGRSDKMTPVGHSYEIVRRVPHAELVVLADTGHMLMLERPAEVNHELIELLARVNRAID